MRRVTSELQANRNIRFGIYLATCTAVFFLGVAVGFVSREALGRWFTIYMVATFLVMCGALYWGFYLGIAPKKIKNLEAKGLISSWELECLEKVFPRIEDD